MQAGVSFKNLYLSVRNSRTKHLTEYEIKVRYHRRWLFLIHGPEAYAWCMFKLLF